MNPATPLRLFCRLVGATALGVAATAAVVLLMQLLIEPDGQSLDEPPPGATLTFLPLIEEVAPERAPVKPTEPPPPVPPPPPPERLRDPLIGPGTGTEIGPPRLDAPTGPGSDGGLIDGDALPIVKVRPVYPARAQQQGIEGHVLVQFTIDELGRVVDVQVVEAEPRGMFERAALKAVERFRYKPRVVNGEATAVSGVQHLVTFELSS